MRLLDAPYSTSGSWRVASSTVAAAMDCSDGRLHFSLPRPLGPCIDLAPGPCRGTISTSHSLPALRLRKAQAGKEP